MKNYLIEHDMVCIKKEEFNRLLNDFKFAEERAELNFKAMQNAQLLDAQRESELIELNKVLHNRIIDTIAALNNPSLPPQVCIADAIQLLRNC